MSSPRRVPRDVLLASLPAEWADDPFPRIQSALEESKRKLVVVDDDPTRTQTVHDIPVLTEWSVAALASELRSSLPAFYVLTNSRSMPAAAARNINSEIARNLLAAAKETGREFVVASRSDSTLRGHFPDEPVALAEALPPVDAILLIPCFHEGGRITVGDVHYVAEGAWLAPAGDTAFAHDPVFGYRNSNLREWILEKGANAAIDSISVEELRLRGPEPLKERLLKLPTGSICIINAASRRDLEVFVQGLLAAEAEGRRFIYRTAASFVAVRAALRSRPLLQRQELGLVSGAGGLVLVGSYVPKTSQQLQRLFANTPIKRLELETKSVLGSYRNKVVQNLAKEISFSLNAGHDVTVFSSRDVVKGANVEENLSIQQRVSAALVEVVTRVSTRPRFIIAKGGVTASDIATQGLGVRRAMILGQIVTGVPVWRLGPESRWPGLAYIVFPGNVGEAETLVQLVTALK